MMRYLLPSFLFLICSVGTVWSQPDAAEPGKKETSAPATEASDTKPVTVTKEELAGSVKDGEVAPGGKAPAFNDPTMALNLRLRRMEQRVQALKERVWRAKARGEMLKESVLGGGVGAQAQIIHKNQMGSTFRLIKLAYALDGKRVFTRTIEDTPSLYKDNTIDILSGPIPPGSHTISVLAVYKGHGFGVVKYVEKYKFTVRSSHTFVAGEGKTVTVEVIAKEKGGKTTPMKDRPTFEYKVIQSKGLPKANATASTAKATGAAK